MTSLPATPLNYLPFARENKRPTVPPKVHSAHPANRFIVCQVTPPIPERGNQRPGVAEVHAALVDALRTRGNRKQMRRPPATRLEQYLSERGRKRVSAWQRSHRHLRRVAYRALNDLALKGFAKPGADVLAAALLDYIWEHLDHLIYMEPCRPSKFEIWATIPLAEIDNLASFTTRVVTEEWDARWIEAQRTVGRKGGQRSRRGPIWTEADLDRLQRLHGLTRAKQALVLGCSERTVARMIRVLRDRQVH